jgi:hypothetical protein
LRESIETVGCEKLPGGIGGVRVDDYSGAGQRLALVAALLLEGDAQVARSQLARVPATAWHEGDPNPQARALPPWQPDRAVPGEAVSLGPARSRLDIPPSWVKDFCHADDVAARR